MKILTRSIDLANQAYLRSEIVYLILASSSPEHVQDEATQRDTWASKLPEGYAALWLRGSGETPPHVSQQTLWVSCADSEILRKTILGLRWLLSNSDFSFLVRTNVSTYFHVPDFSNQIRQLGHRDYIAGYVEKVGDIDKPYRKTKFVSGAGLVLPRITVQKLAALDPNSYLGWPDDVAITNFLLNRGTRLISLSRSNIGYHHIAIPSSYIRCKSSSKSHLASARMERFQEFFTSQSLTLRVLTLCKLQFFELHNSTFRLQNIVYLCKRMWTACKNYIVHSFSFLRKIR